MTKLYWIFGSLLLGLYLVTEVRGMVFSGTDRPGGPYVTTSGGQRSPRGVGGFIFFGTGYRGGK